MLKLSNSARQEMLDAVFQDSTKRRIEDGNVFFSGTIVRVEPDPVIHGESRIHVALEGQTEAVASFLRPTFGLTATPGDSVEFSVSF